jgi:hypothetical protein
MKKLSLLKKGDWFRFIGKNKTYVYNGKVRIQGTQKFEFEYYDFEDINNFQYLKTDKVVDIDFEF